MDKKLLALIALFFLSFAFFTAAMIFDKPFTNLIRAKEDSKPSPIRSKILAWPLSSLNANGDSQSTINVFVVSESDKPIVDKRVMIVNSIGTLTEISAITDNNGKASFSLSSTTPGIAEIEATIEPDIRLSQKVTIEFE